MKLSEAISLAAMLTPQAITHFIDDTGGRCAWASAFDAVGHPSRPMYMDEEWKWTRRIVNCPLCKVMESVAATIVHLNAGHRWTRQRIAEWISTIEPTEQTSPDGEEFSAVA
jgi:hypothetical protein